MGYVRKKTGKILQINSPKVGKWAHKGKGNSYTIRDATNEEVKRIEAINHNTREESPLDRFERRQKIQKLEKKIIQRIEKGLPVEKHKKKIEKLKNI